MFHSPTEAAPQFLKKLETCSMNPHLAKAKLVARIFFPVSGYITLTVKSRVHLLFSSQFCPRQVTDKTAPLLGHVAIVQRLIATALAFQYKLYRNQHCCPLNIQYSAIWCLIWDLFHTRRTSKTKR